MFGSSTFPLVLSKRQLSSHEEEAHGDPDCETAPLGGGAKCSADESRGLHSRYDGLQTLQKSILSVPDNTVDNVEAVLSTEECKRHEHQQASLSWFPAMPHE
jgi:hypothetical protein